MAAPVIWFGSWLFSLMACSGSGFCRLFGLELWEIKKGPKRPPRTPPEFGMASATPGGAPGYDENQEFGNNITHAGAHFPKDCAKIATKPVKSRQGAVQTRFLELSGVPAVRRVGICCNRAKSAKGALTNPIVCRSRARETTNQESRDCRFARLTSAPESRCQATPSPPPARPIRIPAVGA